MGNQADDRLFEEVRDLLAKGETAAALDRIENVLASRKVVGPEHALQIQSLISLERRADAMRSLENAAALPINDADSADSLAFFARHLSRHELSNKLYRRAIELNPSEQRFWYNLASSEMSLGNLAEAAAAVDKACKMDPRDMGPVLLRSAVTRATKDSNHVEELYSRLSRADGTRNAVVLGYSLGKELHDLGRYDEAFAAYSKGANMRRKMLDYDVEIDEKKIARIQEVFATGTAGDVERSRPARHIFIIGLPRSGTTLTERILGALPDVRSNDETQNFTFALLRHSAKEGQDVFEKAFNADFEEVGREYDSLAAWDDFQGSIIEKLPFNYLYIGAILRAIPDAAILVLRRHPLDSCFAMYRSLFAAAYPFSYSFEELARYYAAYDRLMKHWEAIYPGRIIFVEYEELVHAPKVVASEMARRCGLEWSDNALELSRNQSASLTASAAQVREGIYTSSAGIWRRYGENLRPLAEALEANGIRCELADEEVD